MSLLEDIDELLESVDDYLYHVTYLANVQSIADEGLRPNTSGQSRFGGGYGAHSRGAVFLTSEPGLRFWFNRIDDAVTHLSDDPLEDAMLPVVLRIPASRVDDLESDEVGSRDARADAYIARDKIEPSAIEVFNGRSWVPVRSIDVEEMLEVAEGQAEVEVDDYGEEAFILWDTDIFKPRM